MSNIHINFESKFQLMIAEQKKSAIFITAEQLLYLDIFL